MSATAMIAENNVKKIYLTVIDEVLSNVRESFLDEGYDEQLLLELKNVRKIT
jgi:transcription initiation factor TFIIA large subunit